MRPIACRRFITYTLILYPLMALLGGVIHLSDLFAQTPQNPVIGNIRIDIQEAPAKPDYWEKVARNLIFLKEGERFSDEKFTQSLQALTNAKLFKSIDVADPDWANPPITLVFRLTPFARIQNIRINGGFPILEKEMRNVMTVTTGDPYDPDLISEQAERLKELFRSEGFIDPEVNIDSEQIPETGNYLITFDVETGKFFRIEKIKIEGNDAISAGWLKIRLSTWQSSFLYGGPSRLVDSEVKNDVDKLLEYYRSEQYAEAAVSFEIEKNRETRTAGIYFTIREGPRYEVMFLGNDAFWDWTLKKDLVIFERGNENDFGLRKSVRNIKERYQLAGYLDADVQVEDAMIEKGGQPVRQIRLILHEGPRYIVDSVSIEGNSYFAGEKIKEQMLIAPPGFLFDGAFVPATLAEDIRAIKTLYLRNGFLNTRIETGTDRRKSGEEEGIILVDVRLNIEEGPQTIISDTFAEGSIPLSPETVQDIISQPPGTPYRPYLVENTRTSLASRISEKGYPHVTVDPEIRFSENKTAADITYQVESGPYVEMGSTYFIGNFKTRTSILNRQMALEPGEPFSLKEMLGSQSNIRDINALESAQFQTFGLEEKAPRVDMVAEVQERKPYYAQFTTGYDTWRKLYVDTAVGTVNFLGLNKEIRAGLQWSQIGYLAQLGITEPSLLGSRIVANGIVYTEELEELNQNFGVRTTGAAAGLSRDFEKYYTATLNVRYENREQYRTDDSPIPPEDADLYDPRSVVITTPSLALNKVDSFIRPTRGIRLRGSVDISRGLQDSFDDFYKYRFDARYYITPLEPVTFAFHGQYGYIDPANPQSTIPEDQLFFLGGTSDVRGFAENELRTDAEGDPVGGKSAILASMEIRFDVGMNIELVTFYDTGAIRRPLDGGGSDEFRSSAGLGFRYITPIGPIGLIYGRKLDRKDGESAGAFHFNIGYTF